MPSLTDYGLALAAVTEAVRQLIDSPAAMATARTPDAARSGVTGPSVNLFLYRDSLVSYRNGGDPAGVRFVAADLLYLVSCHAADDADAGSASLIPYGAARATIEANPVLSAQVAGMSVQVTMSVSWITPEELASLWLASAAPLRLSFGVRVNFAIDDRSRPDTVSDVIAKAKTRAQTGQLVVFAGTDATAHVEAAEVVARELGRTVVRIGLDRLVSEYIGETEHNLRRLFDSADTGGAVLLVDEADALFGRRTHVREAHGRYAGVTTDRLVDVLATAPGIVIVAATDPRDSGLLGRATTIVRFPPDD